MPATLADLVKAHRDINIVEHAVTWYPSRWRTGEGTTLHQHRELVNELAERNTPTDSDANGAQGVSRADVFACREHGPVAVFVASMIFGFGDRGYGPARTTKMLNTADAEATIIEADRILLREGAGPAHRFLINKPGRLDWCRTPFITKFLYFDGFGLNMPGDQPLIFDQLVRDRLAVEHDLRLHYTDHYEEYLKIATDLATDNLTGTHRGPARADIVEYALFHDQKNG